MNPVTVVGSALPESPNLPQYVITNAQMRVVRMQGPSKKAVNPSVHCIVASPEDPTKVLFVDTWLNGLTYEQAQRVLPVGTEFTCARIEIGQPVKAVKDGIVLTSRVTGEEIYNREARFLGKITDLKRPPQIVDLMPGLAVTPPAAAPVAPKTTPQPGGSV